MRILVFGAGVLGCNLAHCFYRAKKDITLLARGDWGENIELNGLRIVNKLPYYRTKDRIHVIHNLSQDDYYDVIFVAARFTQLQNIIPILNQNVSKNIVLIGNNTSASEYAKLMPEKNVLFAFSSSAGRREQDRVISINLNKITIGSIDGREDYIELIEEAFDGLKYKLVYCNEMDDWLKTHAAFILPICMACYYADGNLKTIRKDDNFLYKVIDATIELYDSLKANGNHILPEGDYDYVTNKKKFMKFLKLCCGTFLGKIMASDHAMSAVDEMSALTDDFKQIIQSTDVTTPNFAELTKYMIQ